MRRPASGGYGYRGVRKYTDSNRKRPYYARVKFKNQEFYSPAFARPHEAAIAYDALATVLHGDRAVLNFPVAS
jgi:hypothetical protein